MNIHKRQSRTGPIKMFTLDESEYKDKKSRWDSDINTLEAFHLYDRVLKFNQNPLPYPMNGLEPIMSEEMMLFHYAM